MKNVLVGLSLFFGLYGYAGAVDQKCLGAAGCPDGVDIFQLANSTPIFTAIAWVDGTTQTTKATGSGGGASVTTATLNYFASDGSTQAATLWVIPSTGTGGLGFYVVGSSVYVSLTPSIPRISLPQTWTGNQIFSGSSYTFTNGAAVVLTTTGIKIGQHHMIFPSTPMANGVLKFEGNRVFTGPDAGGGGSGDNLGNHTMTQTLVGGNHSITGVNELQVTSITTPGTNSGLWYSTWPISEMVVKGATYTFGASSFTVAWNNGPKIEISSKTPLNLPLVGGRFAGSSTMTVVNDTCPVNGGTLFDAFSSTTGNNTRFFVYDLAGNLDNSFVPILRHFTVACASAAGNNNNIVAAADGLAQTYTLSFATAGANTNLFSLVYTNPISMTLTGSTTAGGTRERRDLSLTGLQTMLSDQVTRLYIRLVRSGADDASTTQSVFVDGLIELRYKP